MDSLTLGSHRLVHLDLKGAPPKVSYLEKLFVVLRQWGATGILLEWEDTFPYRGDLMPVGSLGPSNPGPYATDEAKQLVQLATDNGLIVMPLVQTFGHFEFVLKHDQFRALREVPNYPSSMCPSNPESLRLVKAMIQQVVNFHPDIQFLHIGGDEVWHLGLCSTCVRRMESQEWSRSQLFLDHIVAVLQFIRETYPSLRIIMWDDMLRQIDLATIQEYNLGWYVEPMVWHYRPQESFQLPPDMWDKYSSAFTEIWVATAFKGATGSNQIIPVIQHHISNHQEWLRILNKEVSKFQTFRGVAFTGWSRYDHYATMCELLPAGIPSLALCLKTWQAAGFTEDIHRNVSKSLGYIETLPLNPYPRPQAVPQELDFPGWKVVIGLEWFLNLRLKFRFIVESEQMETWCNPWQVENNFTNPMQIESLIPALTDLLYELMSLETYIRTQMEEAFYPPTVDEWLGTLVEPLKTKLKQLKKDAELQMHIGGRVRTAKKIL